MAYTLLSVLVFMLNYITGISTNMMFARSLFTPLIFLNRFHDTFNETWKWISLAVLPVLALIIIYSVIRANQPEIKSAKGGMLSFFTSAGIYNPVSQTNAVLSITGSIMLLGALLTFQFIQIPSATVNARYNLENIIVTHQLQMLEQKWNLRFPPGTQKSPLPTDLSAGIAQLSRIMEREIMRSFSQDSISMDSVQQFRLASTQLRQNLLKAYVAQKQAAADPHAYQVMDPFDSFETISPSPAAASFIKAYAYQAAQPGPVTGFGKKWRWSLLPPLAV